MSGHAVLGPSKASRWMTCTGSVAFCDGMEQTSSVYADEGTTAHTIAAARLLNEPTALVAENQNSDFIDVYVNALKNASEGKILLVEQRLNIEKWTGERDAKGTADGIIIDTEKLEIEVWDLKFGMGHIVYAENNEQLMHYGLAALDLVESIFGPVNTIKLVICQPRRDHFSEFTILRSTLLEFGELVKRQAGIALSLLKAKREGRPAAIEQHLVPSEKACTFCVGKATCPALAKLVQDTVFEEFAVVENNEVRAVAKTIKGDDVPSEAVLDMITDWVKAKSEWIDSRLRAGEEMPGWKLVLGKKGNRKFTDLAEVERLLKSLKFKKDQIYETSLIGLTAIEKLVPKAKWPVFERLIVQGEAKPVAASASDKRPAYAVKITADDFQSVEENFDAFV